MLGFDTATLVGQWAAAWPHSSPTSSPSAASAWCWWPVAEPAATCRSLLRLASAPLVDVFLALLRWPLAQPLCGPPWRCSAGWTTTCRDRAHVSRILPGCPMVLPGRFTRTLRSVVHWRGQVVTLLDRCYLVDAVPVGGVGRRDGSSLSTTGGRHIEALPASRFEICWRRPISPTTTTPTASWP